MNDPNFLTLEDVFQLHEDQLERYGGADGVRDRGALESAVATPQATFGGEFVHKNIFEMAAAYAFHIAQAQAFLDGNKRTGLLAALVFLDMNGHEIEDSAGALYQAMIDIAERRLDKTGLAALIQCLARQLDPTV